MRIVLFAARPADPQAGGHFYHRRMVRALREAGHEVETVLLEGAHPLPDARAAQDARAAWCALAEDARPVIDGMVLSAFGELGEALERATGLIHHPTALAPDLPGEAREELRALERRLHPLLGRMIATSEPTAARLHAEFGVADARIATVTPGTDDVPRAEGSGGPGCAILSVGALLPRKRHDVLLRAVARLFDLDWSLTLVGAAHRQPAHVAALRALAEELGIAARVRFAGAVDDATLETAWRGADLFALASDWEGYGMAVAEALKRGLPVAISSGAAAGLGVPVEAGIICPPGDHEGLSKAMRRLVFDGALRRAMGEVAWQAGRALPDWPTQAGLFAGVLA